MHGPSCLRGSVVIADEKPARKGTRFCDRQDDLEGQKSARKLSEQIL